MTNKAPTVSLVMEKNKVSATQWEYGSRLVLHDVSTNSFLCYSHSKLIHETDSLRGALYWMLGSLIEL